jgi:hypothetical protein
MDRAENPFAPNAGARPPELAGRDELTEDTRVEIVRVLKGRSARGRFFLGLRGVGKTVLLNKLNEIALDAGAKTIIVEAPEDQRLPALLVPPLRALLLELSRVEAAKTIASRALGLLRSFASAFKLKIGDFGLEVKPILGDADSGELEHDLPALITSVTEAARAASSGLILLIDEVQFLEEPDLRALIVTAHKLTQRGLPFLVIGAGLPQLAALAGEAKSYAERLFLYPRVGELPKPAAEAAIVSPLERAGVAIQREAFEAIYAHTRGYPFFLQEWAAEAWNTASRSPITRADVDRATITSIRNLDENFFQVRFGRLTTRQKAYLRAMADLGPGPTYKTGDIVLRMGAKKSSELGPLRDGLIKKGMIYAPSHGLAAFTVPLFDEYMKRAMPDWQPPKRR